MCPGHGDNCRTRREAGYALVDMLASLAILAVVAALLPPALRHVERALSTGVELESRRSVESALFAIESRLREAMAVTELRQDGQLGLVFRGDTETLEFVAPLPPGTDEAGLALFRITLEPDELQRQRHRLMCRRHRYDAAKSGLEERLTTEQQVVLSGSARFLYFGALVDGEPSDWQGQWSRTDRLPDLIALEVQMPPSQQRTRVLTVAPKLGLPRNVGSVVSD